MHYIENQNIIAILRNDYCSPILLRIVKKMQLSRIVQTKKMVANV